MNELNIFGIGYTKKTKKYDSSKGPEGKRVKNKLHRRFYSNRPYQKMVSDVTEFKVKNGEKVYLEPIMDLYNNQILTYSIANKSPDLKFAIKPLEELRLKLPKTGYKLMLHTDQGWQYRHRRWRIELKKAKITQSMSRRSCCLDNGLY
ncbi:DDE-type integrase/transposase/recombinase [Fructilactobacillus hinvesii]|uniref:DDE-type integrase/transposase/recombinase n=1 Tax=Fructilactobacillus hinvesii TaxID=2940300 RepID=A0ABY5BTF3_9LACO|nr:DDE-type integrase/transposase/recombinase [Fructilactobacillus hinvesii]USS87276.1 DDE-type integrase/transposase/recombinase [Fructilactobacillus hinvesii]